MITVACVWVQANVPYGVEYVERLRSMVARHLDVPYRFVCLTDRPAQLPDGVSPIDIEMPREMFGWWAKVELFREKRFAGRVLYLDLDTIVVDTLRPILEYPTSFALVQHAGTFVPKGGYKTIARFNSSVMVWDADVPSIVHREFRRDVAEEFWGDQDWIGHLMPFADVLPLRWFPRISAIEDGPVPDGAIVVLSKKPKNVEAAKRWAWVREHWR